MYFVAYAILIPLMYTHTTTTHSTLHGSTCYINHFQEWHSILRNTDPNKCGVCVCSVHCIQCDCFMIHLIWLVRQLLHLLLMLLCVNVYAYNNALATNEKKSRGNSHSLNCSTIYRFILRNWHFHCSRITLFDSYELFRITVGIAC